MATRIVAPDAGQTTDELVLVKWHVAVGDEVAVGDFVADLETDKAVLELEAYVGGTVLALLVEEGDTVTVGDALLWIGEAGEEVPCDDPATGSALQGATAAVPLSNDALTPALPQGGRGNDSLRASPAARTLARERGVDVATLQGSGPDGCVVKRDVLAAGTSTLSAAVTPSAARGLASPGAALPLSPMRRAIGRRLQESVREAPHFYVAMDVDMTAALALREATDPRPSLTDITVKAAAETLRDFPRLNAHLEGDALHLLADVSIGIAVSIEDGLLVPVLANADGLSLAEVTNQTKALIAQAREGRLQSQAPAGFTISNLGMLGVKWFTAIINPPEVAILAVGAVEERLTLTASGIVAVPTLTLTLSSDHRVIDGALAAQFLQALKGRLETH